MNESIRLTLTILLSGVLAWGAGCSCGSEEVPVSGVGTEGFDVEEEPKEGDVEEPEQDVDN